MRSAPQHGCNRKACAQALKLNSKVRELDLRSPTWTVGEEGERCLTAAVRELFCLERLNGLEVVEMEKEAVGAQVEARPARAEGSEGGDGGEGGEGMEGVEKDSSPELWLALNVRGWEEDGALQEVSEGEEETRGSEQERSGAEKQVDQQANNNMGVDPLRNAQEVLRLETWRKWAWAAHEVEKLAREGEKGKRSWRPYREVMGKWFLEQCSEQMHSCYSPMENQCVSSPQHVCRTAVSRVFLARPMPAMPLLR